ncbi:EI24 domain-containing protein [Pseudoduganella namucuonensis]|uniref:Etoposide-induced protein 2.4 (EI24) n=1 Tax=Pseudoduganella namucuonensis TaxID=1035707 RepID=A0A1I7LM66_9BURK|nr:EI24 domain-containing protein [Pseudoduganella namucuonensis]SFV10797.1 Etoposide-induced protein 2.4 (EI24) [Pseudoduganella namucuonensis]
MKAVLNAYGRALLSQLHGKMLLLSVVPFLLSLLLWGLVLYLGWQPLLDYLQGLFVDYELFRYSSSWLTTLGLAAVKTFIVPLAAILAIVPLMILTALVFIGVAAMPFIVRHVGGRHYPKLEMKNGGSVLGSVGVALRGFALFALVWLLALPLYAFPPAALALQVCLWGWLTSRVMAYDALADYASEEELKALRRERRWPLMAIGVVSGAAGAIPGVVWLVGTAAAIAFFPFLAALSLWLYVLIFIFTGLWFQYYCLEALAQHRALAAAAQP